MTTLGPTDREHRPSPSIRRRPSPVPMIFRMHRAAIAGTVLTVGAFAGVLAILRYLASAALQGAPFEEVCPGWAGSCVENGMWWWERGQVLPGLTIALLALPTVTGCLVGAGVFARDQERGTDILLQTQGLSARRWWVARMLVIAAPVALLFAALGALARSTFDAAFESMSEPMRTPGFEITGPVLAGYFLLALGLTAAAGAWTHHTPAAITLGLVGTAAVVLAVGTWVRPHYQAPLTTSVPITVAETWSADRPMPPDWILDDVYVDPRGGLLTASQITCDGQTSADWQRCFADQVAAQRLVYQPADRWLRFQLTELAVMTMLGLGAAVVGFRRSRGSAR